MDCPRCNLVNPPTAERCDCGYDFRTGQVLESYVTGTAISARELRPERWVSVALLALLAAPALVYCIATIVLLYDRPPSSLWQWASGAQLWFFAAPLTAVAQIAVWLFAPPRYWLGRAFGALLSISILWLSAVALGTLFPIF